MFCDFCGSDSVKLETYLCEGYSRYNRFYSFWKSHYHCTICGYKYVDYHLANQNYVKQMADIAIRYGNVQVDEVVEY